MRNSDCTNGSYFHLDCLGLKRKPNNYKKLWLCSVCKVSSFNQTVDQDVQDELIFSGLSYNQDVNRYPQWMNLTDEHFAIINSKTGWLDDEIINNAQFLIKQCNPLISGLQHTALGPCNNFTIMTCEFIQILHTGNNHWVCVSSIGSGPGEVNLYDSLFSKVSEDLRRQIKCLIGDDLLHHINIMTVQQQQNGYDCGLFAIAFATCLAFHISLENAEFDCIQMCNHLNKYLLDGNIEPFPLIFLQNLT